MKQTIMQVFFNNDIPHCFTDAGKFYHLKADEKNPGKSEWIEGIKGKTTIYLIPELPEITFLPSGFARVKN